MGTYKDKYVQVDGHRLKLYEPGYQFAAILNMIDANPNRVTYQYRCVAQKVLNLLSKATHPEGCAVLWDTDSFTNFPLLASLYLKNINSSAFYLTQNCSGFRINDLVTKAAENIRNAIEPDLPLLLQRLYKARFNSKIIVVEARNLKHLGPLFQQRVTDLYGTISTVLIMNYATQPETLDYFMLRKNGITIVEEADGSGCLHFPHSHTVI